MQVFKQSLPDYYTKNYTSEHYTSVLSRIRDGKRYLRLSKDGLATASKVYLLWQKIKGWLGFANLMNENIVDAECLKFIRFGVVHNDIFNLENREIIQAIHQKIENKHLIVSSVVRDIFKDLVQINNKSRDKFLSDLTSQLEMYCLTHQESLKPSLWNRLCENRISIRQDYPNFGNYFLWKAKQCISVSDAIDNFLEAAQLHCSSHTHYRLRLIESFRQFEFDYSLELGPFRFKRAQIYLLLAEWAYHRNGNALEFFSTAELCDSSAIQNYHRLLWVNCLLQAKSPNLAKIEELLMPLDNYDIPGSLKETYVNACITLADSYFEKSNSYRAFFLGSVSLGYSSIDHSKIAIKFLEKALPFAGESHSILEDKIKTFIIHLPPDDPIRYTCYEKGCEAFDKKQWYDAIRFFLIAMESSNGMVLSSIGQDSIPKITEALTQLCKEEQNLQLCLDLVDQALLSIRIQSVNDLKKIAEKWEKPVKNVLEGNVESKLDIGANLLFIKAKIMQTLNDDREKIIASYQLARQLTDSNPHGEVFLLTEDL